MVPLEDDRMNSVTLTGRLVRDPQVRYAPQNQMAVANFTLAVDRMRGDVGTKVTLYIKRRGWTEPKPFVITREKIQVKSVTSQALKKDNIGYLKHFACIVKYIDCVSKAYKLKLRSTS